MPWIAHQKQAHAPRIQANATARHEPPRSGGTQLNRGLVIPTQPYAHLVDANDTWHTRTDHFDLRPAHEAQVGQALGCPVRRDDALDHCNLTRSQVRKVESYHDALELPAILTTVERPACHVEVS
jgi:hypothetical protein